MSAVDRSAEVRALAAAAVAYGPLEVGVPWDVGLRILGYEVPRNATWGDVLDAVERVHYPARDADAPARLDADKASS